MFLDRDGTINEDNGYLGDPSDFRLIEGTVTALQTIQKLDFELVIVTNQGGIARGYYTEEQMTKVHDHMEKLFQKESINLLKIYYCPHHVDGNHPEYGIDCNCRKPKPGLLKKAFDEFQVDMEHSWMVGDKNSDMEAGLSAGLKCVYVGRSLKNQLKDKVMSFNNLLAFSKWIQEN